MSIALPVASTKTSSIDVLIAAYAAAQKRRDDAIARPLARMTRDAYAENGHAATPADEQALLRARLAFSADVRDFPWMVDLSELDAFPELEERAVLAGHLVRILREVRDEAISRRAQAVLSLLRDYDTIRLEHEEAAGHLERARREGATMSGTDRLKLIQARDARNARIAATRWTPIAVQRLLGCPKKLLVSLNSNAPVPSTRIEIAHADDVAVEAHRDVADVFALLDALYELRDDMARDLMNPPHLWSNADVARLLDLSAARVSQIRHGSR